MHDDPALVIATVAAMVGGLLAFALLLLGGGVAVRWLKLPKDDLPVGPRHEAPPPAIHTRADRAQAVTSAQRQSQLQSLYSKARLVYSSMEDYEKIRGRLPSQGLPLATIEVITRMDAQAATASKTVLDALKAYDARLRQAPTSDAGSADFSALCEREGLLVSDALSTLRTTVATLKLGWWNSRLWIMLTAVLLVLWLVVILVKVWH